MKQTIVLRSPDVQEVSHTTPPKRTRSLPQKDIDFMAVSRAVANSWLASPHIILHYISPSEFETMVNKYSSILTRRLNTGSKRPGFTRLLQQLDIKADTAVKEVKVYIQKKFKTYNAKALYPGYGIVKENKTYLLPADRNKRLSALQQMKDAIVADGFGAEEFGRLFWEELYTAYTAALKAADLTDGQVSTGVSEKNDLKKDIIKVMNSLRYLLQGNFPDTYKAEFRKWGWQKEDY